MPRVSIIIPAYNVETYISAGIESACGQTEKDIEIIIVDDGSTDRTWNVIQQYAARDHRILSYHQDNAGVSAARNKALEMASGEYVLFLDSDDWLEANTVETLLQNADPSGKTLVCSDCYFAKVLAGEITREQQGKDSKSREYTKDEALHSIGRTTPMKLTSSCYKLFNRHLIEDRNLRFHLGIHQGEDGLFVFEYLLRVEKVKYIPQPLWNILKRSGSACSAGYTKKWNSAITAVDKMLSYEDVLSADAVLNLKAYKCERIMWLMKAMLRKKIFDRSDFSYARNQLKKCSRYLMQIKGTFKAAIKCLLFEYAPVTVLRYLLLLLDNCKKR